MSLGGKRFARKRQQMALKDDGNFPWAEDCQLYAKVEAALGDSRMRVTCSDAVERIATIKGSMHKRTWINVQDIVLVSLRDFSMSATIDRVDIIYKYSPVQARHLRRAGELKKLEETEAEDDTLVHFDEPGYDIDDI